MKSQQITKQAEADRLFIRAREMCNNFLKATKKKDIRDEDIPFQAQQLSDAISYLAQGLEIDPNDKALVGLTELLDGSSQYYCYINYSYQAVMLHILQTDMVQSWLSLLPSEIKNTFLNNCLDVKHKLGLELLCCEPALLKTITLAEEQKVVVTEETKNNLVNKVDLFNKNMQQIMRARETNKSTEEQLIAGGEYVGDRLHNLRFERLELTSELFKYQCKLEPYIKALQKLNSDSPSFKEAAINYCASAKIQLEQMHTVAAFDKQAKYFTNAVVSYIQALTADPGSKEAAEDLEKLLDLSHNAFIDDNLDISSHTLGACSKELLAEAILVLPNDKKIPLINGCFDKTSALGHYFWKERGLFACRKSRGVLNQLNQELKKLENRNR